jgi:hypothetical protein
VDVWKSINSNYRLAALFAVLGVSFVKRYLYGQAIMSLGYPGTHTPVQVPRQSTVGDGFGSRAVWPTHGYPELLAPCDEFGEDVRRTGQSTDQYHFLKPWIRPESWLMREIYISKPSAVFKRYL